MNAPRRARAYLQDCGVGDIEQFVVLGSGLGDVAERLCPNPLRIAYSDIPGMPTTFIGGHTGELCIDLERKIAIALGRAHLYQGVSAKEVVFPIRVAAALGARRLFITNAAGSLLPTILPGSLVMISDHLNLTGSTPLDFVKPITPTADFVSMVHAYSPELRMKAQAIATRHNVNLHEGIYAGVLGPAYETPAEVAMLRGFGASVVGMSTVLEVIAARALGIEVFGVSLATNFAGTDGSHADVLAAAKQGSDALATLLFELLATND